MASEAGVLTPKLSYSILKTIGTFSAINSLSMAFI